MVKKFVFVSFLCLSVVSSLVSFSAKNVNAQHTDVFNIDFDKTKTDKEKIKKGSIEVTECVTYNIAIDKEKLDKNDFSVYDLELLEVPTEEFSKFAWHQVNLITEEPISETQTRQAGHLNCSRTRKGTLYWVADGKKYVHWGHWTFWKCDKGESADAAKDEDEKK